MAANFKDLGERLSRVRDEIFSAFADADIGVDPEESMECFELDQAVDQMTELLDNAERLLKQ